jgi:hypothetical protein
MCVENQNNRMIFYIHLIAFHMVKLAVEDFDIRTLFNEKRFGAHRKISIESKCFTADSAFDLALHNVGKFAIGNEHS